MSDITLKQIRELLHEELAPIVTRLDNLEKRMDSLEGKTGRMEKRLDATFEQVGRVSIDVHMVKEDVTKLNEEFLYQKRLMRRIDTHLEVLGDVYSDNKDKMARMDERLEKLENLSAI